MGLLSKPTVFFPENALRKLGAALDDANIPISCIEILFQQKNDTQINKLAKLFKDLVVVYGRKFEDALINKYRRENIDYDVDEVSEKTHEVEKKKFISLLPKAAPKWAAELKKQKINVAKLYEILDSVGFRLDDKLVIKMYNNYYFNPEFGIIFNSFGGNAPTVASATPAAKPTSKVSSSVSAMPSNPNLKPNMLKTIEFLNSSFEETGFEMAWLNLLFDAKLSVEVIKLKKLIADSQECFNDWLEEDSSDYNGANNAARMFFVKNLPKYCPKWTKLLTAENVDKNDYRNLWTGFMEADIISNPSFIDKWYKATI